MTVPPQSTPPEDPNRWPRPYGPFLLVRKLAEGGMAEIFLAKRRGADGAEQDVVIKRILGPLASQPEFVTMFRDESRLAARLVHPYLVRVHELGVCEGRDYICMEFLAGEDFSALVRTASQRGEYVPVPLVLRVLADAARGLHYAHELGIIHRDVSPSNLYVTYSGQVKVLDFGIAMSRSRRTRTRPGIVKGKYVYMAPEQARGEEVDRRADVFSLGVSLYEALTHVRPFARADDAAVLQALLEGQCTPPRTLRPELSPTLEAVVLQAMSREPSRRYATAAVFAEALEQLLARESPVPNPTHLARYMRASFGDKRHQEMTAIPSLASLGQEGFVSRAPRASVVATMPASLLASVNPPPRARGRSRKVLVGAVLAGVGVLALGGLLVARHVRSVAPPPPGVTPVHVEVPAPPKKEPSPPPVPPAEVQQTAPEVPGPKDGHAASTQVSLEASDVLRVMSDRRARLVTCFEKFKGDLPADEGDVRVSFHIAASGKTDATLPEGWAERPVGRCLRKELKRLRFPTHRGGVVTVDVPLGYRVVR